MSITKKQKNIINIMWIFLLILLFFSLLKIPRSNAQTLTALCVDSPNQTQIQGTKIYIQGWTMSEQKEKEVKVYLDGADISDKIEMYERPDVINGVKGYGNKTQNPKPGFRATIDVTKTKDGNHTLIIKVILTTNKEVLNSTTRNFTLKKYPTTMCLDMPQNNIKVGTGLYVQGWTMSQDKDRKIKVTLDGKDVSNQITSYERPDVLSCVKGYGGSATNSKPGFKGNIDLKGIKDGNHKLVIQILSSQTGEVLDSATRNITEKKYQATMCLDVPQNNAKAGTGLYVQGWTMTQDKERKIRVTIDGKDVSSQITSYERPDVLSCVKGYGGSSTNLKPGFKGNIDLKGTKDGNHKIVIQVLASQTGEVLDSATRNFTVKKYENAMCLDFPQENSNQKGTLKIQGWTMSQDKDRKIRVWLGNTEITSKIESYERPDVLSCVKGYGGSATNPKPGFRGTIDLSQIPNGKQTLKIEVRASQTNELLGVTTRNITVKQHNSAISIDSPQENANYRNTFYLKGWTMSDLKEKEVKAYLDNTDITSQLKFTKRPDVIKVVKDCGDETLNQNPGFEGNINVQNVSRGNHTIKIQIKNTTTKQIIEERKMNISINQIVLEQGTYGRSGLAVKGDSRGSNLMYYKIGDGPNVFFATFSVHGFEDHWPNDGTELTLIALAFKDKLLQMQDQNLANKWTIYILPEINPDGRKYGWTQDGPGRTSLYSKAPGNKGVDINRCWQTGNTYTRYTDNRNYNGTAPYQAYEAEALKNFLLNKKSKNGQTVLVDLHGWYNQTIGDPQIGSYYRTQYGITSPQVTTYGTGYLVNWARSNLGSNGKAARTALIELPKAYTPQEVQNRGFANKYINATINMLRGIN